MDKLALPTKPVSKLTQRVVRQRPVFDPMTGLTTLRDVEVETAGKRFAGLQADLNLAMASRKLLTTDDMVELSLVTALAVYERYSRRMWAVAALVALVGFLAGYTLATA